MFKTVTRRGVLFILFFLPSFYFLKRYLSPPAQNSAMFEIPVTELPENAVYMVRDKKIALIHYRKEIRAVSIACTHLGCTLNVLSDKFVCPCHGSVFTLTGEVIKGPAILNLKELRCKTDGGMVKIYVQ